MNTAENLTTSIKGLSPAEAAAVAAARAASWADKTHARIVTGWDMNTDTYTYEDGKRHDRDAMPFHIHHYDRADRQGCRIAVELEYNRHGHRAIYGITPDNAAILYAD